MSRLRDLQWSTTYSTDKEDLVETFYLPCLRHATAYWRAVGYFSSQVLALISPAIEQFYAQDGKMRLVASPALSEKDRATIQAAYRQEIHSHHLQHDETVIACLRRYLDPDRVQADEERLRLRLLAGMIRDGLLDIRVAVRVHRGGGVDLYHEKIGVFCDAAGDYVTFNGSPNESWNGWVRNAESFALHRSWATEAQHAHDERELFTETWEQRRPSVVIFQLHERVISTLFDRFSPMDPDEASRAGKTSFRLPGPVPSRSCDLGLTAPRFIEEQGLRRYQQECIDKWIAADHRGTFALATGTGKTVIALTAARGFAEQHADDGRSTLVLVVVPTMELAEQWRRNARAFGFKPTVCNSESKGWSSDVELALSALQGSMPRAECVLVTADTMAGRNWAAVTKTIENLTCGMLVIGDEMHALGTRRRLSSLPVRDDSSVGRIGLSATPRRHNDEQGTRELLSYFGAVLRSISIAEAIRLKALCPYIYVPVVVHLNGTEQDEYDLLSRKIGQAWQAAKGDEEEFHRIAGKHLTRRVRLRSHAAEKTTRGLELAADRGSLGHTILYVGEGLHPLTGISQLDYLLRALNQRGVRANKFVFDTDTDQRRMNLDMFQRRDLDVLVAMRCLDEGIDIPEARRGVILASTQNPRQFVQRRGRLLRTAPGKESAELLDVLCLPERQPERGSPSWTAERSLVRSELTRALELAEAADNSPDAPPQALTSIMAAYDLMELAAGYGDDASWIPDPL